MEVLQPSVVELVAAASGLPVPAVRDRLATSLAEAAQTLRVLAGTSVPDGARALEVGAGLGLTSAFFSRSGPGVTALEPAGSGFEDHELIAPAIDARPATPGIGAEALRRDEHGRFDLIVSNNVLESRFSTPMDFMLTKRAASGASISPWLAAER